MKKHKIDYVLVKCEKCGKCKTVELKNFPEKCECEK
jgi:hypothetical protein